MHIRFDNRTKISAHNRFAQIVNNFFNLSKSEPFIFTICVIWRLPIFPISIVIFKWFSSSQERFIWYGPNLLHEAFPKSVATFEEHSIQLVWLILILGRDVIEGLHLRLHQLRRIWNSILIILNLLERNSFLSINELNNRLNDRCKYVE